MCSASIKFSLENLHIMPDCMAIEHKYELNLNPWSHEFMNIYCIFIVCGRCDKLRAYHKLKLLLCERPIGEDSAKKVNNKNSAQKPNDLISEEYTQPRYFLVLQACVIETEMKKKKWNY